MVVSKTIPWVDKLNYQPLYPIVAFNLSSSDIKRGGGGEWRKLSP